MTGPDVVAEHHRGGIDLIVAREGPPQPWRDPEDREVAGGHLDLGNERRPVFADEVDPRADADAGERLERLAAVAKNGDVSLRVELVGSPEPGVVTDHAHDPLRFREGQRANEHGVDHADHHGCSAEAETQDEDGRGREPGVLGERAGTDPEVLPEIGQELLPPALPFPRLIDVHTCLLGLRVVAEPALGLRSGLRRSVAFAHEQLDQLPHVMVELRVDVRGNVGSPEPEMAPPHRCSPHLQPS